MQEGRLFIKQPQVLTMIGGAGVLWGLTTCLCQDGYLHTRSLHCSKVKFCANVHSYGVS